MAITFVNSAVNSIASGASLTITLPACNANDVIIAAYIIADNDAVNQPMAVTSPAGYTEVVDIFSSSGAGQQDVNLGVYWRVHNGTDTNVVFSGFGGADAAVAGCLQIFRGVDTTTPMDVAATTATGIDTYTPNPPSIDWTTAGTWTVAVGAAGHLVAAGTLTAPANYTTNAVTRAQADTTNGTIGMGYNSAPSDPEDPGTFTHNGADNATYAWCAATLALREAPAVTTKVYPLIVGL